MGIELYVVNGDGREYCGPDGADRVYPLHYNWTAIRNFMAGLRSMSRADALEYIIDENPCGAELRGQDLIDTLLVFQQCEKGAKVVPWADIAAESSRIWMENLARLGGRSVEKQQADHARLLQELALRADAESQEIHRALTPPTEEQECAFYAAMFKAVHGALWDARQCGGAILFR